MQTSTGHIEGFRPRCQSCSPTNMHSVIWVAVGWHGSLSDNHRFGILTADTTYNLGDFYVTPLTYPHLMLQDIKTGMSPLMLGPVLIHQRVDFTVFNYFASTLVGCRQELRKLLSFGSDGDKALVEAFTHNFPNAIQPKCFIHFKRNVQEKLKEYGFAASVTWVYSWYFWEACWQYFLCWPGWQCQPRWIWWAFWMPQACVGITRIHLYANQWAALL